jgi:hypothetical protein
MKISLPGIRKGKASKKAVTGFDQAKWIRGFSIAAILIWISEPSSARPSPMTANT